MLPRVRFLQIGDIHLTTSVAAKPFVDVKDSSFPSGLRSLIAGDRIKTVFRSIFDYLQKGVDGVLFMGDLTDYGNLAGYEACCAYITSALQIGPTGRFGTVPVGIVPGNHDVDRTLASTPGLAARFATLTSALAKVGLVGLPVTTPTKLTMGSPGRQIRALLLNSCWGCGDTQQIPEQFREPIAKAIDTAIGTGGEAAIKQYYDRQLDTPAFTAESMSTVLTEIRSMPGGLLPVVVAHHNLLPQRLPRLAPYTELVNGGAIRASLAETQRPLLYLHGHIHEDPIEIVQSVGGSPVVVVSAPLITDGFNVIDVLYSPNSVAIAVYIRQVRFDRSGLLAENAPRSVSLTDRRRRHADPAFAGVFGRILERGHVYWPELEEIGQGCSGRPSGVALELLVEQLHAEGLVAIDNSDLPVENWIIRADI